MSASEVELFISYSHRDDALRASLCNHLKGVHNLGVWHDRQIQAGTSWSDEIAEAMDAADIILLLISPDFIASDFVRTVEIPEALQRHNSGTARVIPILIVPCRWKGDHIGISGLQAFPADEKWVTTAPEWRGSHDAAFLSVINGIERVVEELAEQEQERRKAREAKLESYRRVVQAALADHHISKAEQRTLDDEKEHLGLTDAEAEAVLADVMMPIEELRRNTARYAVSVDDYVEEQLGEPLTDTQQIELTKRREYLGLTVEDVEGVEEERFAVWQENQAAAPAEAPALEPEPVVSEPAPRPPPVQAVAPPTPEAVPPPAAEPAARPPAAPPTPPSPPQDAPPSAEAAALLQTGNAEADVEFAALFETDPDRAAVIAEIFTTTPQTLHVILEIDDGLQALHHEAMARAALGEEQDPWARAVFNFVMTYDWQEHNQVFNKYLAPDIPDKRLRNGSERCELPDDETAICLYDTNAMSSGKAAMIFGTRGIYFNDKTNAMTIAYANLPAQLPSPGDYCVEFGDVSWPCIYPDFVVDLFAEFATLITGESD